MTVSAPSEPTRWNRDDIAVLRTAAKLIANLRSSANTTKDQNVVSTSNADVAMTTKNFRDITTTRVNTENGNTLTATIMTMANIIIMTTMKTHITIATTNQKNIIDTMNTPKK